MDYKKLFRTRKSREKMLNFFSFLPDQIMLRLQYGIKLGRRLNLYKAERFTEKIQWYKIYYRNPIMQQCADKYLVREYVKSKGLEDILIPLIGWYDSLENIDWDVLPEQFVIKTTNGAGGLNVMICHDKAKCSPDEIKDRISFTADPVKANSLGREWAYYGLRSCIVVEKLLINRNNPAAGVNDYKIFCYKGFAKYIVVDVDRYVNHKRNFYDRNWNNLHITSDCPACDKEIEKPKNLNEMLKIAEKLSEGFPYVRVDLYNVDEKIFFGEMTFYPWSGYVQFDPDEADFIFGKDFVLETYDLQ